MSRNPSRTPWKVSPYVRLNIWNNDGSRVASAETPEMAALIVAAVNEKAERDARAADPEQDFNRITEVPHCLRPSSEADHAFPPRGSDVCDCGDFRSRHEEGGTCQINGCNCLGFRFFAPANDENRAIWEKFNA